MNLGWIAAVVLLASCAPGGGSAGPGRAPADLASATVVQSYDPGPRGTLFIEGALGEVVLVAADGVQEVKRAPMTATITFSGLKPGTYVLRPGLRPCSANCGNLSGRTGECEATVEVAESTVVHVTYVPSGRCRVSHQ